MYALEFFTLRLISTPLGNFPFRPFNRLGFYTLRDFFILRVLPPITQGILLPRVITIVITLRVFPLGLLPRVITITTQGVNTLRVFTLRVITLRMKNIPTLRGETPKGGNPKGGNP